MAILPYIQHLLGHSSAKATEIYTHITEHNRHKLRSPLDFWAKEERKNGEDIVEQEKRIILGSRHRVCIRKWGGAFVLMLAVICKYW